jgi:hypothetical protein
MVDWGGVSADAEKAFTLLTAAVDGDVDGGCNEGLLRDTSTWHLAGISDAAESSSAPYGEYVAQFQSMRPGLRYLVFDAIGGPYPAGCSGASFYDNLYDAVVETGGTFTSICTTDWTRDLESWAADIAASACGSSLLLSSAPVPGSLTVTVDGVVRSTGWSLDVEAGAITFEEGSEPAEGATVEVTYATYGECG